MFYFTKNNKVVECWAVQSGDMARGEGIARNDGAARNVITIGYSSKNKSCAGQATVEAAILIPILFLLLLMLMQPGILLYNRMVMQNAAAEGVRLLSTRTDFGSYSGDKYEGYVKRRLASIPPVDIFHAHTGTKTWDIELIGSDSSTEVTVRITNKLKPLPLLDFGANLLQLTDNNGYLTQTVEVTAPTQPYWVWGSGNGSPADWASKW